MPFFAPPVVYDNPTSYPPGTEARQPVPVDRSTNRMFSHYNRTVGRARGRSVLRVGGVYSTVDTPDTNQVAAATEYYAGGHVYEVTSEVASALTAAGYTVYTDSPGALVHGEALIPYELVYPTGLPTWGDLDAFPWFTVEGMEWGTVSA